jgi:hypothetical protein
MGFLLLLAAFFVFRRIAWRHGWHPRYMHRRHGPPMLWQMHYYQVQLPTPIKTLSPKEQREREMNEVKRRYVADEIDVEEYERELDRILRKR